MFSPVNHQTVAFRVSRNKLNLMLMGMKQNMRQELPGMCFQMSQPKETESFTYLLSVLESSLEKLSMCLDLG